MGKKKQNFLQYLWENQNKWLITEIKTKRAFAKACGKGENHMNQYLNDEVEPGEKVLLDCIKNLFECRVAALMEMEEIPKDLKTLSLPSEPGVYVLYDSSGNVLYVGKTENFERRVKETLVNKETQVEMQIGKKTKKKLKMRDLATNLSLYKIDSETVRHNLEALLLRVLINQTHNKKVGEFW